MVHDLKSRPCSPAAIIPDAGNEAQVEAVARALEDLTIKTYAGTDLASSIPPDWEAWTKHAKAVLIALANLGART
jgi:NADH:ubiquinone oxidoreductase subunit